jgi:hypothetical protein
MCKYVFYPNNISSQYRDKYVCLFIGLALNPRNIVFRFIIEYISLRDFGPQVIGLFFYMRIFERWYVRLGWNLKLVIEL